MLAYIILIGVPLLYLCFLHFLRSAYRLERVPYRKNVLKVFFLIYFFLLALRASTVGTDTPNYLNKFYQAAYFTWPQWLSRGTSEVGFTFLTKLIRVFTDNEQVYMTIIAAIIVCPVAYLYCRESEGPVLTMALFLVLPIFGMFFSGFRQAIAIGFAVPAFYCVREKKKLQFALIVLAAMLFHRSAFILSVLYPVYYMRLTRKKLIWIVPALLLIYVLSDRIFSVLMVLLSYIYRGQEWEVVSTGAYSMLLLFSLLLAFSYVFTDESSSPDIVGLRNILVLSVVLQCFASVNTLAMRVNYYFLLFLPLLIPKVISRASRKNMLTCRVANVVFCVYFFYYFLSNRQSGFSTFPYVPFWAS